MVQTTHPVKVCRVELGPNFSSDLLMCKGTNFVEDEEAGHELKLGTVVFRLGSQNKCF